MPLWVGLDVHKQSYHATVLDERGEVVLQKRVPNEPEVLEELFGELKLVGVAMEAAYAWEPVYELPSILELCRADQYPGGTIWDHLLRGFHPHPASPP
jgi:hypothetical protein